LKVITTTSDKSKTVYSEHFGEHYHSSFGARTESEHIFIDAGLRYKTKVKNNISIFEMGFGTGLNALMTYKYALENKLSISYFAVEAFPLSETEIKELEYPKLLEINPEIFFLMHNSKSIKNKLSNNFCLELIRDKIENTTLKENYFDLVFYDAFSPDAQPELWTEKIFEKVYFAMKEGGVLTTYSCKGLVKRNLKRCGFSIEKLPGPPGKREFLRAFK